MKTESSNSDSPLKIINRTSEVAKDQNSMEVVIPNGKTEEVKLFEPRQVEVKEWKEEKKEEKKEKKEEKEEKPKKQEKIINEEKLPKSSKNDQLEKIYGIKKTEPKKLQPQKKDSQFK